MGIKYKENTNWVVFEWDEYDKNILYEVLRGLIKSEKIFSHLHLFLNQEIINKCIGRAKILEARNSLLPSSFLFTRVK